LTIINKGYNFNKQRTIKKENKMINIIENSVNKTDNYIFGGSLPYEAFTSNIGELFTHFQKEYGKCVSSIYRDKSDGTAQKIGWVFEKREQYCDCDDYFIRETWVEVMDDFRNKKRRIK
jgi:hypothetical protein